MAKKNQEQTERVLFLKIIEMEKLLDGVVLLPLEDMKMVD